MSRKFLIIVVLVVLGGVGAWAILSNSNQEDQQSSITTGERKAAHYESNTPAFGAVLPLPPPNVTIDFNFDLASGSVINITKDGLEYGEGRVTIDDNKLAMRRGMKQDAPDGTYSVNYKACWPDGSCHDGNFSFQIDRAKASGFVDMRGQSEVTVKMGQIKFTPMELRISKGTKVTWANDDAAVHYVNTDSHPAHTHTPDLNSKALNKGDAYSYTFNQTGSHPYHCSAHASSMVGKIIVE